MPQADPWDLWWLRHQISYPEAADAYTGATTTNRAAPRRVETARVERVHKRKSGTSWDTWDPKLADLMREI